MDKTKTNFIKKIPLLALIGLLPFLIATNAFAHGVESHKIENWCDAKYFEKWWGAGQCDPNNPKDISGGITKDSNPSGLCYPSFNNFLDEVQDNGEGLDPFQSYPPLFKDERNFFKVSKVGAAEDAIDTTKFTDDITVKDGDTLMFLVYIHNDGDPCLNKDITTKTGTVKDWNTTAYDVTLSVSNFIFGEALIKDKTQMQASIKGSNVINEYGKKGEATTDDVIISPESAELQLKYIEGTAKYIDYMDDPAHISWFQKHLIENPAPLFGTKGLPLSTLVVNGEFKAGGGQGVHFASEPYIGLVQFKVKVEKPKPNICTTLELTEPYKLSAEELKKFTGSEKNGPMYKLAVNKFAFEKFPYPAQTKIKFTSTDPKGKFWVIDFFGGISSLNKNSHEIFLNQFLKDSMTNQIFYTGTGTVTATLTNIPEDQANPKVCTDSVTFQPTAEEKVCKEIFIDHPKTIYTDTVSTFKSEAVDQNDEPFTSYIEYSVDEGYGLFFTTYSFGYNSNTSEMVYEIKGTYIIVPMIFDVLNNLLIQNPETLDALANYTKTSLFDLPVSNFGQASLLRIGDNLGLEAIDGTKFKVETTPDLDAEPTLEQPSVTSTGDLTLSIETKSPATGPDPATLSDDAVTPTGETPKTTDDKDKNGAGIGGILGSGNEYVGTLSTYEDVSVHPKFDPRNVQFQPVLSVEDLKPLFPETDPKMDILTPKGQTKIVVPQGTTVYFYATKEGTDKVHVKTINSSNKACKRDFSIVKSPTIIRKCEDIKVNHNSTIFEKKLSKFSAKGIEEKTKNTFNGSITYSVTEGYGTFYVVKPTDKEENTASFVQEFTGKVTPPEGGKFCADQKIPATGTEKGGSKVTVNPGEEVYFWAEKPGKGVITVDTNCTITTNCARKFDITEVPKVKVCDSLKIKDKPASLKIGEEINLTVQARDNAGATIPAETGLIWSTDTDGTISFKQETSQNGTLALDFSDQPVKFSGSRKAGIIEIGLDPKDKFYSPKCKDFIKIREEEKPLVCSDLATTLVKKYPSNEPALKLTQNEIYTVKGKPTFSKPYPQAEIAYTINPSIGTFISMGNTSEVLKNVVLTGLKQKLDERLLTAQFVAQFLEEMNRVNPEIAKAPLSSIKAKPDETVYLVIYSDAKQVGQNTLGVDVYGFANIECSDTFPLEIVPKACQSLLIEPVYGTFEPTMDKFTLLRLSGDFKDHSGTIDVNTTCGTLSKTGDDGSFNVQSISFSSNEVKDSNNILTFHYKGDASCTDRAVILSAKAIGTAAGICEDKLSKFQPGKEIKCMELNIKKPGYPWVPAINEQLFLAEITTSPLGFEDQYDFQWTTTDGQWQSGTKTGTGINKLTGFNRNDSVTVTVKAIGPEAENCSDSRKIKKEEEAQIKKYVYPTDKYTSITDYILNIGEKKYEKNKYLTYKIVYTNGSAREVKIEEKELQSGYLLGNLGGKFTSKGMTIQIHDTDNPNDLYTIFKTTGYQDDSEDDDYNKYKNNDDLQDYEDDFNCNNGDVYKKEKTVCIEGDFNDVKNDFLNGEKIEFKNLKDSTNIIIKVQLNNESKIDEDYCKTLKTIKGCGESFENEAAYKSDVDSGNDDAKVIVICPFILAREGGDVFFHDVVETGVDVAKCSKVKSAQGPVITPKPKQGQDIPSTGAGKELKDIVLTLPSHDICKYSNLGSNLDGYNNVLENFSSTICELKAEVAKEWKEANIVQAIKDNITRISRFGQNLTVDKITNIEVLATNDDVDNKQSGVFYKEDGNLTIDLNGNLIQASGEIPAAQTYIVKGHDLIIKSDIKYYFNALDFTKPKKIPAAAFIVIDGNIIIDNGVTQIDGVLMAVDTTPEDPNQKGKITNKGTTVDSSETSETQLTINGNLIGNVFELFKSRIFVGDPEKDEGSVTIRYDERIMLNTPPGLSELINLNQTIVPN